MNANSEKSQSRISFFISASIIHLAFLLPLLCYEKIKLFKIEAGMFGSFIFFLAAALVGVALLIFYFRLDLLFCSYKLYLIRIGREKKKAISKISLNMAKLVAWLFIITWPIIYILFHHILHPVIQAYLGVFLFGATLLLLDYVRAMGTEPN